MKILFISILLATSVLSNAQYQDLSSPRRTLSTFSYNLSDTSNRLSVAAEVIYKKLVPRTKDRIELVKKLHRFLKGKGVRIILEDVPDDPNYSDTTRENRSIYLITHRFPNLYLEKVGKNWYLSEETITAIPDLYDSAFPFGADKLLNYLPEKSRMEIFGLQLWQYAAILSLIIIILIALKILNWIMMIVFTKVLFRLGYKELALTYVKPIARPMGLMIAMVVTNYVLPILQLPLKFAAVVTMGVEALIPFFATIAAYKAMDIVALYLRKLTDKTETTLDDQLVPLFRKALKAFVIVIGSIYVLQNLSIDVVPLLGVLSIGGLAFALAAQDTVKNFFGSLMIFIDKPFQVGQWISSIDGIDGTVEEVGIRSTRIRTFSNSVVYVPNGKLADATINNHGLRVYRRFNTTITINYDTPPDLIDLFVEGLRKIVQSHPQTRKDMYHVYLNNMGSHSLDILYYIFFKAESWSDELRYRHEVIIDIIKLANTLGVQFAFPTQTLNIENLPGQLSLANNYESKDLLIPKMDEFFDQHGRKPN